MNMLDIILRVKFKEKRQNISEEDELDEHILYASDNSPIILLEVTLHMRC